MRTSSLLGWFLIISLLLLSQSLIISCQPQALKKGPGRGLVEHEENADGSHGHHHDHLRVFVRKSKKKKKKDKSSATRTLLSNPFTYVVSSFALVLAAF
ncbi:unnamed protein product [Microthlaspi erraticum]|uniref:Transmembrane protein n=1 Tax=Microthlaspi erraticum TaxID=1685480 RepID=A0A6D2KKJ4_9BRAS|nr:unnamed protein product [Microthlaspi erraticum]